MDAHGSPGLGQNRCMGPGQRQFLLQRPLDTLQLGDQFGPL
jgi:hypothetical protein